MASFLFSTLQKKFYPAIPDFDELFKMQEPPIVKTESVKYDPSSFTGGASPSSTSSYPFVTTEARTVGGASASSSHTESDETTKGSPVVTTLMEQGDVITTQSITSKTRTVETVTVKQSWAF